VLLSFRNFDGSPQAPAASHGYAIEASFVPTATASQLVEPNRKPWQSLVRGSSLALALLRWPLHGLQLIGDAVASLTRRASRRRGAVHQHAARRSFTRYSTRSFPSKVALLNVQGHACIVGKYRLTLTGFSVKLGQAPAKPVFPGVSRALSYVVRPPMRAVPSDSLHLTRRPHSCSVGSHVGLRLSRPNAMPSQQILSHTSSVALRRHALLGHNADMHLLHLALGAAVDDLVRR